jgi:hypothetical protein
MEIFIMQGRSFYSSKAFLLVFLTVCTDVWAVSTASQSLVQRLHPPPVLKSQEFSSTKKQKRYLQSNYVSQVAKLTASNGAAGDYFGDENAVAISNDIVVVGAANHDNGRGAAYVFRYDSTTQTCTEIAILKAIDDDLEPELYFGAAVDVHEDAIVVGAVGYSNFTGAAYIFSYNKSSGEVSHISKITASIGSPGDYFGDAVSIHGNAILVGAYEAALETEIGSTGFACIYVDEAKNGTWSEKSILMPSVEWKVERFGLYVDIYDKFAVVGTEIGDSAFVFQEIGEHVWNQVARLTTTARRSYFGSPVSVSRNRIVVGAFQDSNVNGADAGAIYVYENESGIWTEVAKLISSSGTANRFGYSSAISDDASVIVVGATGDMDQGINSGAAFIFKNLADTGRGWTQVGKFVANDGAIDDELGVSIAISSNIGIVGAKSEDNLAVDSGSAYLFDIDMIPGESSTSKPMVPSESNTSKPIIYGTVFGVIFILAICGLFFLFRARKRRLEDPKKSNGDVQQHAMNAMDHEVMNSGEDAIASRATVLLYTSEAVAEEEEATQIAVPIYPAIAIPDSGIMPWDSMVANAPTDLEAGETSTSNGKQNFAGSCDDVVAMKFQLSNNKTPSSLDKTPCAAVLKGQVRNESPGQIQGTTFRCPENECSDLSLNDQKRSASNSMKKKNDTSDNDQSLALGTSQEDSASEEKKKNGSEKTHVRNHSA